MTMKHPSIRCTVRTLICVIPAVALTTAMVWAGGDEDRLKALAAESLKPFKQRLMSALVEGLKEGPEAAIQVCSDQAPKIAAEAGSDTVTLGRTSHRVRNPANAPQPWMTPLLEAYAGNLEMTEPTLVSLPGCGHGYVEPITVRPACLSCHGATLAPAVEEKIDALYPDDQARGFGEGDFRGLFWVRIDPAE